MNILDSSERKFKFSVIMAVYDCGKYLTEAVESILNQDLGFEDNVQLILVDDGSSDDSLEICRDYQKKYSSNITVLTQEHCGIASARNLGLKHACGEYVNFLDSDDSLSENALSEVYGFFTNHSSDTDVVCIPMFYFEREDGEDELNDKFSRNGVIDLNDSPDAVQVSLSSCFLKASLITESFDVDMICSEDILLLYKILLEKKALGVVNTARYHYRKRLALDAVSDSVQFKKEFYTPRLNDFHLNLIEYCKSGEGEIPLFVQHLLIYDLKSVVGHEDLFMCDDEAEEQELFDSLKRILSQIDEDVILNNNYLEDGMKCFMYGISAGDDSSIEQSDDDTLLKIGNHVVDSLNSQKICLSRVSLYDSSLVLIGFIDSYFDDNDISVEAVSCLKNGDEVITSSSHLKMERSLDLSYLSRKVRFGHFFDLRVPLDLDVSGIMLRVAYNGDKHCCPEIGFSKETPFSRENNIIYDDDYDVIFRQNTFNVFNRCQNEAIMSDSSKDFTFKFAVVMAVYNTEEYLNEAIDSVIGQTIGFEDNVQLILVNDGSEDSSEEIMLSYQKQYPKNITVVSQENSGQASARNNGLEYVDAKYVNFLDSDDYLAENAFEEVYSFFEKYYDETNIVAIPITFFGKKESPHMLNGKFKESKIINLDADPNNPQLSASSAFFKSDVLKDFKFPTNVIFSEDSILINKILLEKRSMGVIDSTAYYYRKRFDESSTIDVVHSKKEFFTDKLKYYYLYLFDYAADRCGEVPEFIHYTLAYDLQWVFYEDLSLLNKQEIEEFWFYLVNVLKRLDDDAIQKNRFIRNSFVKQYMMAMKEGGLQREIIDNNVLIKRGDNHVLDRFANHKLWLDIIDLRDGYLDISGFYNSLFDFDHISIDAVKEQNDEVTYHVGSYVRYTSREDMKFLSDTYQYRYNFDIRIPIKAGETSRIKLKANYHKNGDNRDFSEENLISAFMTVDFTAHCKMSELSRYKVHDSNMLFFRNNSFYLIKTSLVQVFKKEILDLREIKDEIRKMEELRQKRIEAEKAAALEAEENEAEEIDDVQLEDEVDDDLEQIKSHKFAKRLRYLYLLTYPFFRLFKRNRKIYFFEDRIDVADDNATHLFKYAVKVKDNARKYFVLSKESRQYRQMSKIGKVLDHGSIKHKLLMLHADKIITTHPYETVINPFWAYPLNQRHLVAGILNYQIYFLQHGVTKDNISDWMSKYDKHLSLVLTVSDKESESFLDEGYGYDEAIIQNLGFPRFDNLKKNDNKQILIIPTWRKTARGERKLFTSSDYFKYLNSLLKNPKLKEFTDKGYRVVFKPHPELVKNIGETEERYIELFDIPDNIYVSYDESYQELLNNSSLMVTDYSSVYFDFAYLKKPVIYYHPVDDYHYEESYFDYETMGFGEVIGSEDDLLSKIEGYVENGCVMEEEYQKRVDDFFTYRDKNNCKRVYDWINEH